MAVNRSTVFDNFLRKSSKPFSRKSLIQEVYRAEKLQKILITEASPLGTEKTFKHCNRPLTFLSITVFLGPLFSGSPDRRTTYSREATLIRALLNSIGQSSFSLFVLGRSTLPFSSQGIKSSMVIFLQQPWKRSNDNKSCNSTTEGVVAQGFLRLSSLSTKL